MMVDPRTQHLELPEDYRLDETSARQDVEEKLLNLVIRKRDDDQTDQSLESPSDAASSWGDSGDRSVCNSVANIDDFLSPICKAKARGAPSSSLSIVKQELEQFAKEPPVLFSANVLTWWKQNSSKYPNISSLARETLVVQATSVPSERLFSKAGELISSKRSSLKPKNVNKLLFLNQNIDKLG